MNIDRVISIIREHRLNEMMVTGSSTGTPGFSEKSDEEGPTAGISKKMFAYLGRGSRREWLKSCKDKKKKRT
jgi:hypothetical protein